MPESVETPPSGADAPSEPKPCCLACAVTISVNRKWRTRSFFYKSSDAKSCNSALRTFRSPIIILPPTPSVHDQSTHGHLRDINLLLLNQQVSVTSTCLPYLTLPYLTLPYLTLPYLTLPYLTLPYLTLPYLTSPYLTMTRSQAGSRVSKLESKRLVRCGLSPLLSMDYV